MKLIDLLVQELPNRGGWPGSQYEGEVMKIDNIRWSYTEGCYPTAYMNGEAVRKSEYEAALAASKQHEWPGEGLPPAGCECEWQDRNTKHWTKVSVVYASEWVTVIRECKITDPVELAIDNYGDEDRRQFRPIRTEAERKRDDRIVSLNNFIDGFLKSTNGNHSHLGEALYEWIAVLDRSK